MSTYVLVGLYVLLALAALRLWVRELTTISREAEQRILDHVLGVGSTPGAYTIRDGEPEEDWHADRYVDGTHVDPIIIVIPIELPPTVDLSRDLPDGDPIKEWHRRHAAWMQVPHPNAADCPAQECETCSVRDCPGGEPLHYHHDGCPWCCMREEGT